MAADVDEFKVKRQHEFAFAQRPVVTRDGNTFEIRFATTGFCDVTVVIENAQGRIVRHLACGVLGDSAPLPLLKSSLSQRLVWDGKNDRGEYVDDLSRHNVRVSLGLDARFEKALYWSPQRRTQQEASLLQATPEGVYVYDGRVLDHLRLFDHDGDYVRTIYPFPADKLADVQGLHWREFPQDGRKLPLKQGFHQATLLGSGRNAGFDERLGIGVDRHNNYHGAVWGNAASALAVRGERLALARLRLARLATDGTTGGLPLTGPEVIFTVPPKGNRRKSPLPVPPRSAAFSPDGRWLYLTGYVKAHTTAASRDIVLISRYDWLPVVARIDFAAGEKLEVFAGSTDLDDAGKDNGRFLTPTSVAVDAEGRVYVSDFAADRIHVYSSDGTPLKSFTVEKPAQVEIHPRTGQVYVFSWWVPNEYFPAAKASQRRRGEIVEPTLTVLKSVDDPTPVVRTKLTVDPYPSRGRGLSYRAALDAWADPPTVWLVAEWGRADFMSRNKLFRGNVRLFKLEDGELKPKRDFNEDVRLQVARTRAAAYARQRLFVNPADGSLYVAEGQAAVGKSFQELVRIDPDSGRVELVPLPFDAEDMCFDLDGRAYLRTFYMVARYDPRDWSEVPWDYGEEHPKMRTGSSSDAKPAAVMSALRLPVKNAGLHHHGGMAVSPRGRLAVAVNNHTPPKPTRRDIYDVQQDNAGTPYTPAMFPGRVRWGEVHVWDEHGQMVHEDAVPGLNRTDGIGIDDEDNLYLLATATRVLDGRRYFNDMTETLVKLPAVKAKLISPSDRAAVPLTEAAAPKRPPELSNNHVGRAWLDGAEWFYGGVGFAGKNAGRSGGGCDCYNARFALDALRRSFAPEIGHHSVAVLDSAGNLILRIGRYGNADSQGPESPVPLGGDEVGLFYAPYVAVYTDRRLFIADPGNSRIVSVQLSYAKTQRLTLGESPATTRGE